MKKRDVILIVVILVAAAALFFGINLFSGSKTAADAGYVSIAVTGREWVQLPLAPPTEYTVHQTDGKENTIKILEGGTVYVSESSCDNHDCVKQGEISRENVDDRILGNQIICLPNSVVITVYYGGN